MGDMGEGQALREEIEGLGSGSFSYSLEVTSLTLILTLSVLFLGWVLVEVLTNLIWKPYALQRMMASQGIMGPPYRPLFGNLPEIKALIKEASSKPIELSHDIMPRLLPYYLPWAKLYGEPFLLWFGWKPRLSVSDPELIKEVLSNKFGHFGKTPLRPDMRHLVGKGTGSLTGELWEQRKRIINPAFHVESLKGMIPTMVGCTEAMLGRWKKFLELGQKEVEMHAEFRTLTADIISQTAFGSSYTEGKRVFELQRQQTILAMESIHFLYIPGSRPYGKNLPKVYMAILIKKTLLQREELFKIHRFLPTPKNIQRWKLDREIKAALSKVIHNREQVVAKGGMEGFRNDLLGRMMNANKGEIQGNQHGQSLSVDEIIDECKAFYFAGHETTSSLLTWTIMALGVHTNYQDEARAEVFRVCGDSPPNSDSINNLKLVSMILYESLRLYCPAITLIRRNNKEMKLGEVVVPKGVDLILMVMAVHHDKAFWGEDVLMFKPERFINGASRAASIPSAFMPFGMGQHACIGQNFAMQEAKISLAMVLQRYSFVISPSYQHSPTNVITLLPQFGLPMLLEPVDMVAATSAS